MKYDLATISQKLSDAQLNELAHQTNFSATPDSPINGARFVHSFFAALQTNLSYVSLSDWAHQLMLNYGVDVSRQALDNRTSYGRQVDFARGVLQQAMACQLNSQLQHRSPGKLTDVAACFGRILLNDSSCVKLPPQLHELFPGAHSRHGNLTATARIQLTYDLLTHQYVELDLLGYRQNDQSYAYEIVSQLRPADLVLRDQGYFVLGAFEQIAEKGAYFLSRLRPGTHVYRPDDDSPIDLLALAEQQQRKGITQFEIRAEVGKEQRLPVRILFAEMSQQQYQARRRKAIKDRSAKANHNQTYLRLLNWTILITNAEPEQLSVQQALKLYGFRWQIEIMFKTWKSSFNLQAIFLSPQGMKDNRMLITMYLALAFFVLSCTRTFQYVAQQVYGVHQRYLSLIKWTRFLAQGGVKALEEWSDDEFIEYAARALVHDRRKDRQSAAEAIYSFFYN